MSYYFYNVLETAALENWLAQLQYSFYAHVAFNS